MSQIITITDRMDSFLETIASQAKTALFERKDDMLKAWHECIEEANANEKPSPPMKLGISATVDIEKAKIETTIRFTAVYSSTISAELPDPNQPELL